MINKKYENCYFIIPARHGSKGLPLKNQYLFNSTAEIFPEELKDKVYVTTDDPKITKMALKFGFQSIARPHNIALDNTSMKDVLKHAVTEISPPSGSIIILLYLTYPDRSWNDVEKIYDYYMKSTGATSLVCCEEIDGTHPYLCTYENKDMQVDMVVKHSFYRRQDYPRCLAQSMFMACYDLDIIDNLCDLMYEEKTILYKLEQHKIDVDYEKDFKQQQAKNADADVRLLPREFKNSYDVVERHYGRYFKCIKMAATHLGTVWLDCASGAGYGTNLMTNFAKYVVGYDISQDALEYAKREYANTYSEFTNDIEKYESAFDVAISVETIEHMSKSHAIDFLKCIYGALKLEGILVITTPIVKKTNLSPTNKHHQIEYSDIDFRILLASSGYKIVETVFQDNILFTDGEVKSQGYYKCVKEQSCSQ